MNKKNHILHISPNFNYSCGISKYVFSLIKNMSKNPNYKIYFITNGGDAINKFDVLDVKPNIIKFSRGFINIKNIIPNYLFLKKFCIENEIDIIHTHHRYPELLAYFISKKINIKTITTVHSIVEGKNKFSFKSDKFIAVSNSVKIMLIDKFNVPERKINVMYNFLDPSEHKNINTTKNIRSELGIPDNGKIILYVGRITKIKGVDILIESFKKLKKKYDNIHLIIIGQIFDNSLKNIFNNLTNDIKFLNVLKNPYPYYTFADVVVLPSRIEPLGYVMLEAGLMKKPFIGSKTGGINEFIENGKNGLLFAPGNIEELTEKISYIIEQPEKGKLLAENLFNTVKEKTSSDEYFNKLNIIYKELLLGK